MEAQAAIATQQPARNSVARVPAPAFARPSSVLPNEPNGYMWESPVEIASTSGHFTGRWGVKMQRLMRLKAPRKAPTHQWNSKSRSRPQPMFDPERGVPDEGQPPLRSSQCDVPNTTTAMVDDVQTMTPRRQRSITTMDSIASATSVGQVRSEPTDSFTISERSGTGSIIQDSMVIELGGGFYAAPNTRIEGGYAEDWELMRSRLSDTLRHVFQPVAGIDPTVSIEFMFAGNHSSVFKPTIIIVCCHETHKTQLTRIMKKQKWSTLKNYPWQVIVDTVQGLSGSLSNSQIVGIVLGVFFFLFPVVVATCYLVRRQRLKNSATYQQSTRKVSYKSTPVAKPHRRTQSLEDLPTITEMVGAGILQVSPRFGQRATVYHYQVPNPPPGPLAGAQPSALQGHYLDTATGGLQVYSAQTSSPMRPLLLGHLCRTHGTQTDVAQYFTIGGIILVDGVQYGLTTRHGFQSHQKQALARRNYASQHPTASAWTGHMNDSENALIHVGSTMPCEPQLDWALVQLDQSWRSQPTSPTRTQHAQQVNSVSSIRRLADFEAGEVTILAGRSGSTRGWLRSPPVSMQSDTGMFDAWQVVLETPLTPGDSGSWVVRDGHLYGHIYARRLSAPIAYMLPIESIFDDIHRYMEAETVSLLASIEMDQGSHLLQ